MEISYAENPEFYLAAQFVLHTDASVFLSGRAGTGKTTFLRYILSVTDKKTAVTAPTGIAAINAGGVTLHSFLQLPVGAYLPNTDPRAVPFHSYNRQIFLRNLKMGENKRRLLRELELLIIDEVSMLRCDTLDAIDTVLKFTRQSNKPFGGLQILFVGDLQQLPPVINQQEWEVLKINYNSPFFYSGNAFKELEPVFIEFKKIYRQSDQQFIELLEKVRQNKLTADDLEFLNQRYDPGKKTEENIISLTTHNHKAEAVNRLKLESLPGALYTYEAQSKGDFTDKHGPADLLLQLKTGAQVMFLKNDSQPEKRYYNGKLGTVGRLSETLIEIEFLEGGKIELEKETWRHIRYRHNDETDKVEEEETGSFTQYPIRLAWAITIHKSQGLTFDSVVIDAQEAFEAGQVYVALSRCRTLEGIRLSTPITPKAIARHFTSDGVEKEVPNDQLVQLMESARRIYTQKRALSVFRFGKIMDHTTAFYDETESRRFTDKQEALVISDQLVTRCTELQQFSEKFIRQVENEFGKDNPDKTWLTDRIGSAMNYFCKALYEEFVLPLTALQNLIKSKKGIRQYLKTVKSFETFIYGRIRQIQEIRYEDVDFSKYKINLEPAVTVEKPVKAKKGDSHKESLKLFREGKSIAEIAAYREMAVSTIESHILRFISSGELSVFKVLTPGKIDQVTDVIRSKGLISLKAVKDSLGNDFSYGEIRMVMAGMAR